MGDKWKKDGSKKAVVNVRLPDLERKALELMASGEGQTLSEMTRKAIREAAQARGVLPTKEENWRDGVIVD